MSPSVSQLASLLVVTAISISVNAGGLHGQSPTYAAGYAPGGYAVGYAAVTSPVTVPGTTYVSGYAPTTPTYVDSTAAAPLSTNGVYQSQRPTYFDNPSVYTGLSATGYQTEYQSYYAPLATSLRGNAAASAYVEAYPSTYYASSYDGSIPGQPLTVTSPTGLPASAIPATPVAPIYAPAPPSKGCCLSRLYNKMFGTSYSTSYYRAPITYYRPVTSTDPMTGAAVVVQQPCTSYVQQVQRTPYNTLQFGQQPTVSVPTSCPTSCPTNQPNCGPATYNYGATTANPSNSYEQYGTIGQVGALGSMGEITNIPGTAPISPPSFQPSFSPSQSGASSNTAPLTGAPTIAPPPRASDLAPVGQPRLENGSPPSIPQTNLAPPPNQTSPSHWQLQNAEDSTALIRPKSSEPQSVPSDRTLPPPTQRIPTQRIIDNENFTRAEPIEAPADYVAPFRRQSFQTPRATPVTLQEFGTMGHPDANRTNTASDLTSVSARMPSTASNSIGRPLAPVAHQPTQKPRDTTWTSVRP